MAAGRNAVERNSDGSYDAVDSGGFGKDYHGQDVFGERIGGGKTGNFGGFAAGHVGLDEDNKGHYEKLSYGDIPQTESMPKSAFEADNSNESAEEEAGSGMGDTLRDSNPGSSEENNNVGSLDTSSQIGGIEEDEEKYQKELKKAEENLERTKEWAGQFKSDLAKGKESINNVISLIDNNSISSKIANIWTDPKGKAIDKLEELAKSFGYDDFDRNKIEEAYKKSGTDALRKANDELFERKFADIDKTVKGAQSRRDNFKSTVDSYKSSTTDKTKSSFTDKMEQEKSKELDEDKEQLGVFQKELDMLDKTIKESEAEYKSELEDIDTDAKVLNDLINTMAKSGNASFLYGADNAGPGSKISKAAAEKAQQQSRDAFVDNLYDVAKKYHYSKYNTLNKDQLKNGYFEGPGNLPTFFKGLVNDIIEEAKVNSNVKHMKTVTYRDQVIERIDELKASIAEKTKSSFTDKTKEVEAKAGPGPNMAKASVGESDYLTKANKDSTKELPKGKPSRNDYPNHIVDTLKGAADVIADNTTAKALGIQSLEDFAKENGVDPNKLSTMKAYRSYQNKRIWKAIPNLMKKVDKFFTERIKDFFDPSQIPERVRNTLARYNAATLLGAAILSIKSGAGLQASIDQALTMVDPEDQPDVSDFLESVLNDEGTVADLSNAIDDALVPEQTSETAELDDSIVNIGRKNNTDYSDFNAGLGTSGTTSDADVKVFIARNVEADPILRRMISKMGK